MYARGSFANTGEMQCGKDYYWKTSRRDPLSDFP